MQRKNPPAEKWNYMTCDLGLLQSFVDRLSGDLSKKSNVLKDPLAFNQQWGQYVKAQGCLKKRLMENREAAKLSFQEKAEDNEEKEPTQNNVDPDSTSEEEAIKVREKIKNTLRRSLCERVEKPHRILRKYLKGEPDMKKYQAVLGEVDEKLKRLGQKIKAIDPYHPKAIETGISILKQFDKEMRSILRVLFPSAPELEGSRTLVSLFFTNPNKREREPAPVDSPPALKRTASRIKI